MHGCDCKVVVVRQSARDSCILCIWTQLCAFKSLCFYFSTSRQCTIFFYFFPNLKHPNIINGKYVTVLSYWLYFHRRCASVQSQMAVTFTFKIINYCRLTLCGSFLRLGRYSEFFHSQIILHKGCFCPFLSIKVSFSPILYRPYPMLVLFESFSTQSERVHPKFDSV